MPWPSARWVRALHSTSCCTAMRLHQPDSDGGCWGTHGGVEGEAEALSNTGVSGHSELAATEDVAACEVLACLRAKQVVAECVGELAIDLIGPGGGELQHHVGEDGVCVGAVGDTRVSGGAGPKKEEILRVEGLVDDDVTNGVADEVVSQPACMEACQKPGLDIENCDSNSAGVPVAVSDQAEA